MNKQKIHKIQLKRRGNMLKIKDSVDFEKLEEIGFYKSGEYYFLDKQEFSDNCLIIDISDKKISLYLDDDEDDFLIGVLFNMIKLDLMEES